MHFYRCAISIFFAGAKDPLAMVATQVFQRVTSAETHAHPCAKHVQVREQENVSKTTLIPWTAGVHIFKEH